LEVDAAFDGVASILETDALGLLNIQSVAFSMSPPYRTMIPLIQSNILAQFVKNIMLLLQGRGKTKKQNITDATRAFLAISS